jgi:hypothetical protein
MITLGHKNQLGDNLGRIHEFRSETQQKLFDHNRLWSTITLYLRCYLACPILHMQANKGTKHAPPSYTRRQTKGQNKPHKRKTNCRSKKEPTFLRWTVNTLFESTISNLHLTLNGWSQTNQNSQIAVSLLEDDLSKHKEMNVTYPVLISAVLQTLVNNVDSRRSLENDFSGGDFSHVSNSSMLLEDGRWAAWGRWEAWGRRERRDERRVVNEHGKIWG